MGTDDSIHAESGKEFDKNDLNKMSVLAEELAQKGQYDKAAAIYQNIINTHTDSKGHDSATRDLYNYAAAVLLREKKYAEVESICREILPEKLLDWDEAVEDTYEYEIQAYAQIRIAILRMLMEACENLGKHEEAKGYAGKAMQIAENMREPGRTEQMQHFKAKVAEVNPDLLR